MILSSPISVDINITNICNLSCQFCSATPFHHSVRNDELSIQEISLIFDELDSLGVFIVRIAGGEPLARRDISEIINLTKNRFFDTIILSNGMLLKEHIVKSMVKSDMRSIALSIDGHVPSIHDRQRNKTGSLVKTLSKLPLLRKYGIYYTAMTTVTSTNVEYLTEIVSFLYQKGFKSVNFILLNYSGLARSLNNFSTWKDWSKALQKLTIFLDQNKLDIAVSILPPHEDPIPYEIYLPLKEANLLGLMEPIWGIPMNLDIVDGNEIGCAAGRTQLTIFENGDVYGCELMRDYSEFKAGSTRSNTLRDIWKNSTAFSRLRKLKKSDLTGSCKKCEIPCGGGCRASAANITGKINGSDENCHAIRDRRDTKFPYLVVDVKNS